MTFEYREAFNDAIRKGEIKLALRKYQCTFCNKTGNCMSWCPERLPWVIPVCDECFFSFISRLVKSVAVLFGINYDEYSFIDEEQLERFCIQTIDGGLSDSKVIRGILWLCEAT